MKARSYQEIYDYIFGDPPNIEESLKGVPEASLAGARKSREIKKKQKEDKIRDIFFGQPNPLIQEADRVKFRAALQSLRGKNSYLETVLYSTEEKDISDSKKTPIESGNNTPEITKEGEYQFLSSEEIKGFFNLIESDHHFFNDKNYSESQFEAFYKMCRLMGDFVEQTMINHEQALRQAYAMLVVFGSNPKEKSQTKINLDKQFFNLFDDYLKGKNYFGDPYAFYNALTHELPKNVPPYFIDLKNWRSIIKDTGVKAFQLFRRAHELEFVKDEKQTIKHREIKDFTEAKRIVRDMSYANAAKAVDIADLFMQYNLPEIDFNHTLEINEHKKDHDDLPDLIVDGSKIGLPGYFLAKLPFNDPRAYVLGEITNCCQSMGGNSEQCVVDGVTKSKNGFLVLLKDTKNKYAGSTLPPEKLREELFKNCKIRGQGYFWLSNTGNLTIDSWENLEAGKELKDQTPENRDEKKKDEIKETKNLPEIETIDLKGIGGDDKTALILLQEYAKQIVQQKSSQILRVTIGTGGKTPINAMKFNVEYPELMSEGEQYPDSKKQKLLYINKEECNKLWESLFDKTKKILGDNVNVNLIKKEGITSHAQAKRIHSLLDNSDFITYLGFPHAQNVLAEAEINSAFWNVSSILNEANLFNKMMMYSTMNFLNRLEKDNLVELEKIILQLKNANLLTSEFYPEILKTHDNNSIPKLSQYLNKLQNRKILNVETISLIIRNPQHLANICHVLIRLHDNNLLTPTNLNLIKENPTQALQIAEMIMALPFKEIEDSKKITLDKLPSKMYIAQILCAMAEKNQVDLMQKVLDKVDIADINYVQYRRTTPLMYAAMHGNLPIIRLLFSKKADVNITDSVKQNALQMAANYGQAEAVIELMKEKIKINHLDEDKFAALHYALNNKDASKRNLIASVLLNHPEINVNIKNKWGQTPLFYACWYGDTHIVNKLLEKKAHLNVTLAHKDIKPEPGITPFYVAVNNGHVQLVAQLLDKITDLNAKTITGNTVLHAAAKLPTAEMLQLLLEHKANVNEKNNDGNTPLHLSVESNLNLAVLLDQPGVDINAKNNMGETPIFLTIHNSDFRNFMTLLSEHADINSVNNLGNNVLHLALEKNFTEVIHVILQDENFDKNLLKQKNLAGETPLDLAFRQKKYSDVIQLLANGATFNLIDSKEISKELHEFVKCKDNTFEGIEEDQVNLAFENLIKLMPDLDVNARNVDGQSLLMLACEEQNLQMMKILIEKKADVATLDNKGNSVLHYAAKTGNSELINFIVSRDVKIDLENTLHETPLFEAIKSNNEEAVEILLEKKASATYTTDNLMTPLHLAVLSHSYNMHIIDKLLMLHADINFRNITGNSAIHVAAQNGNFSLIETLLARGIKIDTNIVNKYTGENVLHSLAMGDYKCLITSTLLNQNPSLINNKNYQGLTPLDIALYHRNLTLAEFYIKKGAHINIEYLTNSVLPLNSNSLIVAIKNNYTEIKKLLLSPEVINSVDFTQIEQQGFTLLHYSVLYNHTDVFDLCLNKNANINQSTFSGITPLHLTVLKENVSLATRLAENKVIEIDAHDNRGFTALLLAAEKGNIELIKLLIKNNADPNLSTDDKDSALMLAIKSNHPAAVLALLDAKVDVNLRDNNDDTALSIAIKKNFINVVRPLLDYKADLVLRFNSLKNISELTDSDAMKASILFKEEITEHQFQTLTNQLEYLKQFQLKQHMLPPLLSDVMESKMDLQSKYYKIIEMLYDQVEIALSSYSLHSNAKQKIGFFEESIINPREIDLYGGMIAILKEVENHCRIPLNLPEGLFKTPEFPEAIRFRKEQ